MKTNRRSGFTIIELLVVVGILLLLAGLSVAVYNSGKSSDRMRSGARTAQSAFLGAKDRALHAKDLRGVRLTHDQTNFNLVNGFVYILPLPPQTFSPIVVTRPSYPPDPNPTTLIVSGRSMYDLDSPNVAAGRPNGLLPKSTEGLFVRIPAGGPQYEMQSQSTSAPYWCTLDANGNTNLLFYEFPLKGTTKSSFFGSGKSPTAANSNAVDVGDPISSVGIELGNDILPFHQPITLPSGCVIDLYRSQIPASWYTQQSTLPNNVPALATVCGPDPTTAGNVISRNYTPQMDVMFSPRGNVAGTIAGYGAIYLLLRDMRDATNNLDPTFLVNQPLLQGDMLILAVFPGTGLVSTFEADLTDSVNNATGAAGSDGYADNLAGLAQRGMAAGR